MGLSSGPAQAQTGKSWAFEKEGAIGGGDILRVPIDVALGPDGTLLVADTGAGKLLAFSSTGQLKWTFGKPGRDPGQFARIATVAALPSGEIAALDTRRQRVVMVSPDGQLVQEPHLPFALGRVDDMVGLSDGRVALTARTRWEGGDAHLAAVHVFERDLTHVRSFGPVPDVTEPNLQLSWGVGSLRNDASTGGLILGLKIPYEILLYTEVGERRESVLVQSRQRYSVDDIWDVDVSDDGRVSTRLSGLPVEIPSGAARIVGGAFLSQRSIQGTGLRYWDVIDASGRILESHDVPDGWLYPNAVSRDGSKVYVIGEHGGAPAIIVVRVEYSEGDQGDP